MRILQRTAVCLLFVLMTVSLLKIVGSYPKAEVDEPGWISSGFLTWQLVTGGASPKCWASAYDELRLGPFGHQNPPFGKFLIGAVVALVRDANDPINYHWEWPRDYDYNLAAGNIPPVHLLAGVRIFIALVAATCLVLVYLIAREMMPHGMWHPLVASVLLFINPTFRHLATHVYTDVPLMCLTLASIWLILVWFRRKNNVALLAGLVTIGLACATKFSAGSIAVSTVLAVSLIRAHISLRMRRAAIAVLVPSFVFITVNPYLWRHPVGDTLNLMHQWSEMLRNQQIDPVLAGSAVLDRFAATRLVFCNAFLLAVPSWGGNGVPRIGNVLIAATATLVGITVLAAHIYLTWRRTIMPPRSSAIAIFGIAYLSSILTLNSWKLRGLVASLPVAGLCRMVQHLRRHRRCDGIGYFCIVFAGTVVGTVMWLPFDWDRYYMPVLALTPILASLGVMECQEILLRFCDRKNTTANKSVEIPCS